MIYQVYRYKDQKPECSNWRDFCDNWRDFRRGYQRYKAALKRGKDARLDEYFINKKLRKDSVRFFRGRGTKYHRYIRNYRLVFATPKWVDCEALINIYINCPKGYHVDHIIPLVNSNVCGLHVPWNLQYLPANLNNSKSNKFDL